MDCGYRVLPGCTGSGEIMHTAYSYIGLAPINTAEHFLLAAHLGFNTIKGDVRITSDDGLVMCHDPGFTMNEEGRIIVYHKGTPTPIIEHTFDYWMSKEYEVFRKSLGYYSKVCSFDTFIRICRDVGKVAFITVRADRIPAVIRGVMEVLKKYNMENQCVINSFEEEALREVRKYSDTIPVSLVAGDWTPLETEQVERMSQLGNAIITLYHYPAREVQPELLWEQSKEGLALAKERGIPIHMAQVDGSEDYFSLLHRGVQGFQMRKPILEYPASNIRFTVTVQDGQVSFGNVLGSNRLEGQVSMRGGIVTISHISKTGSGYGFDDGLPALWLNKLPYFLHVSCKENPDCTLRCEDGVLLLDTCGVDGEYIICVTI